VVAIDDLQWGDADSAAVLADLVHHPSAPPILLVACHRSEDEARSPVLALVRAGRGSSVAPPGALREIAVGALSDDEALALLAEVGGDDDTARKRALVRDCGGSPFFLTELARDPATGDGAMNLDRALQSHFERLPDDARALLQLCAVAAQPLATDLALRAAGLRREGAAVATLRTARMVRVRRVRDRQQIEPYHDRIREAVVASLDAEARRGLHRALAQALEPDGARDHEALVMHWLEAGEPRRAGRYAARGAAAAEDALAFEQAARLYAIALAHGDPDAAQRRAMMARRAHALTCAGSLDEAAEAFAAAAADATGDDALELRRLAVEQWLRAGQPDRAMADMDTLLRAIGYRLPRSRAGARASLLGQGLILKLRGDRLRRRPKVALTPAFDRRIHVLHSLATGMAFVNPFIGRVLQFRLMRDALASADKRYYGIGMSMNFGYLGSAGPHNLPRVESLRSRGLAVATELGDAVLAAWVEGGAGMASMLCGRWREGYDRLQRGVENMRGEVSQRWQLDVADIYSAAGLWYLGRTADLVEAVSSGLREAEARGDRIIERGLRSWRSNATWLVLGRPDEAEAHVDAVVPARQPGEAFQLKHYYELLARGQIALYRGDGDAAFRRLVDAWRELEGSMLLHVQIVRIEGWHLRGRCALGAAATASDAEPLLRDAARAVRRIEREGTPWGAPLAAALRAGIAHRRDRGDEARAALEAAVAGFAAADMALYEAAARRRLGALRGDDAGAAMIAEATAFMTRERVADPDAMTAMLVPGWAHAPG